MSSAKIISLIFVLLFSCACGSENGLGDVLEAASRKDDLNLNVEQSNIHFINTPDAFIAALERISDKYHVVALGMQRKKVVSKETPNLFHFVVSDAIFIVDVGALKKHRTEQVCDMMVQKIVRNEHNLKLGFDVRKDLKLLLQTLRCDNHEVRRLVNLPRASGHPVPDRSEWYPAYHLAPRAGWMNDPNGLIHFDGHFHFFYQHNPSAPVWGPMHWGHARSTNMLNWEHLPVALAPDTEADKDGCFSGSAVNDNGTLTLLYTGHVVLNGSAPFRQVQCIATSRDGVQFEKGGVVLEAPTNTINFRDPKAWSQEGAWFMVVGASESGIGEARLYKSRNLHQWEEEGVLAQGSTVDQGFMWECPDFFELHGKHVLVTSPQGIPAEGYDYRNLYQSGYSLGRWGPGKRFEVEEDFRELDHGHDFYAPQSFLAPDGRRVVVGWMAMWERPMPEAEQGWATHMTLPREVTLADDGTRLLIRPIREVESWRREPPTRTATIMLEDRRLPLECGLGPAELLLRWNLTTSDAERFGVQLGSANNSSPDGGFLRVFADAQSQRLVLDRSYPRYGGGALSGYRSVPLPEEGTLEVRLFFDRSSVEVFVSDGAACLSSRIYPEAEERCLSLFAEGGCATLVEGTRWVLDKGTPD